MNLITQQVFKKIFVYTGMYFFLHLFASFQIHKERKRQIKKIKKGILLNTINSFIIIFLEKKLN